MMFSSRDGVVAVSVWAALYVFAIAGAIFHRVRAGGSLRGLAERKFEEIPALRWLLQSAAALALVDVTIVCGEGLVSGGVVGATLRGSSLPAWIGYALLLFAAAIGCLTVIGWLLRQEESRPAVELGHLALKREMSGKELAEIGSASQDVIGPSDRSSKAGWNEWRAIGLAGMGSIAIAAVRWYVGQWPDSSVATVGAIMRAGSWFVREVAAAVPPAMLSAVAVPAAISAGVLTTDVAVGPMLGRSARLGLEFGLVSIVALLVAVLAVDARCTSAGAVAIFGVGLMALSLREQFEDRRLQVSRKTSRLRESIMQPFPPCDDELRRIASTALLKPLSLAEVRARIEGGFAQLESRSSLVPRLVGRLMKVTDVATAPCAAVALRFLVIRRSLILEKPRATRDTHRSPVADVWNQRDFPIAPPAAYEAVADRRVALPPAFDIVKACSDCGGGGWVWCEESYSDSEPWTNADGETEWRIVTKWREERHTCGACSGTGSLRYTQVMVTSFKTYQPTVQSNPRLPNCTVLDGTSELDVLRRPLLEAFIPVSAPGSGVQLLKSIGVRLHDLMARVVARHTQDAKLVADHYGGRVYRSEVALFLSHAVRIGFAVPGCAWFFGTAPGSYFRRIPLSWSTLVAVAVLPPLAVYGLIEGCSLIRALLGILIVR